MKIDAGLAATLDEVPKKARELEAAGFDGLVSAEPDEVAGVLKERFGGVVDRVLCTFPFATDPERRAYLEELRAA